MNKTKQQYVQEMIAGTGKTAEELADQIPLIERRAEQYVELDSTAMGGFDFIVQVSKDKYLFFRCQHDIDLAAELRECDFKPTDDIYDFVIKLVKKHNMHMLKNSVVFHYADTLERLAQQAQLQGLVRKAEIEPRRGVFQGDGQADPTPLINSSKILRLTND